jgi:hypothetical protein
MLLNFPRELRDMIIEKVLLTSQPTPQPQALGNPDRFETFSPSVPLPPIECPLLLTSKQLRAETRDCLTRINVPLELILVQANGMFFYTWLNRPWNHEALSRRISTMKIRIRVQPVALADRRSGGTFLSFFLGHVATRAETRLSKYALSVARSAVCTVLFPQARRPRATLDVGGWISDDNGAPFKPMNSIGRLQIEVSAAKDDLGVVRGRPRSADPRDPRTPSLDDFVNELVRCSEDELLFENWLRTGAEGFPPDIENYAVLTHTPDMENYALLYVTSVYEMHVRQTLTSYIYL